MDEVVGGWTNRHKNKQMERQAAEKNMDGKSDRHKDGQTNRHPLTDSQTD
jgi:hypothetical protein